MWADSLLTEPREAQEYWSGYPIPSPGDLPDPGIKPGSPALQSDSLPAELPGKPPELGNLYVYFLLSYQQCSVKKILFKPPL